MFDQKMHSVDPRQRQHLARVVCMVQLFATYSWNCLDQGIEVHYQVFDPNYGHGPRHHKASLQLVLKGHAGSVH